MPTHYALAYEDAYVRVISQKQNGHISLSEDGTSAIFTAHEKTNVVGKSALSAAIDPITTDDPQTINVSFDLKIPSGSPDNSIILADFESTASGIGANPGVRVYLRDGYLRVDRSKIGESEPWYSDQDGPINIDDWNAIEITMIPGANGEGLFEIRLNGQLILSETGNNVLSDEWKASVGLEDLYSPVDRVQVGLTANSNTVTASVEMRDLEISVDDMVVLDGFGDLMGVADETYAEEVLDPLFLSSSYVNSGGTDEDAFVYQDAPVKDAAYLATLEEEVMREVMAVNNLASETNDQALPVDAVDVPKEEMPVEVMEVLL